MDDETQRLLDVFSLIDEDGGGEISAAEVKKFTASFPPPGIADEEIDTLVPGDINGAKFCGLVNVLKDKTGLSLDAMIGAFTDKCYAELFNAADEGGGDGDGTMSRSEFRQLVEALEIGLSANDIVKAFDDKDADKSGEIDIDEFIEIIKAIAGHKPISQLMHQFREYQAKARARRERMKAMFAGGGAEEEPPPTIRRKKKKDAPPPEPAPEPEPAAPEPEPEPEPKEPTEEPPAVSRHTSRQISRLSSAPRSPVLPLPSASRHSSRRTAPDAGAPLQARIEELEQAVGQHAAETGELQRKLRELEEENEELRNRAATRRGSKDSGGEVQRTEERYRRKLSTIGAELRAAREEAADAERARKEAQGELERLRQQKEELEERQQEMSRQLSSLRRGGGSDDEIRRVEREAEKVRKECKQEVAKLQERVGELSDRLQQEVQRGQQLQQQVVVAEQVHSQTEQQRAAHEREVAALAERCAELEEQLRKARSAILDSTEPAYENWLKLAEAKRVLQQVRHRAASPGGKRRAKAGADEERAPAAAAAHADPTSPPAFHHPAAGGDADMYRVSSISSDVLRGMQAPQRPLTAAQLVHVNRSTQRYVRSQIVQQCSTLQHEELQAGLAAQHSAHRTA